MKGESILVRFWKLVDRSGSCWLWKGATSRGYGRFRVGDRKLRAHRFIWEHINGPIPVGHKVRHTCDTPACVNPKHLCLGTQKQNMQDAVNKGRTSSGVQHPKTKLSVAAVQMIRQRPDADSHGSIAKEFGVDSKTVWCIRKNVTWKTVPPPEEQGDKRV